MVKRNWPCKTRSFCKHGKLLFRSQNRRPSLPVPNNFGWYSDIILKILVNIFFCVGFIVSKFPKPLVVVLIGFVLLITKQTVFSISSRESDLPQFYWACITVIINAKSTMWVYNFLTFSHLQRPNYCTVQTAFVKFVIADLSRCSLFLFAHSIFLKFN